MVISHCVPKQRRGWAAVDAGGIIQLDCTIVQSNCRMSPVTTPSAPLTPWSAPRPSSETREQLLAAGERLFVERGFAGVSIRTIAAEAGVNWSLVGYYFRRTSASESDS